MPKENKIDVSIIVPVYNVLPYIRKCIDSLVHQTLENIEIILVDDGSCDGSQEVVDEYLALYPDKIKVIHKENGGLSDARNCGLEIAIGEYIGFVDSDDFADIHMYEDMYNAAKQNKSDIVCTDYYTADINGNIISIEKANARYFKDGEYNIRENKDIMLVSPSVWSKIIRSSLIKENKFKFRKSKWYEDLDFTLKCYMVANTCYVINKPYYYYVQRPGSIMNNSKILRNLEIIDSTNEVLEFAKVNNIYGMFKEEIEYTSVMQTYVPTIVRIIRAEYNSSDNTEDKKSEKTEFVKNKEYAIQKIQEYMQTNFKGFEKNKYIKLYMPKSKRCIFILERLRMYNLIYFLFKMKK